MALQGTLKDFGLADIFQLISIQRKTGVLSLKRDEDVVSVSFLKGQVVYADTRKRQLEQKVGALLVNNGKITPSQLEEALKVQSTTLQPLGAVLVARKVIAAADLKEVLRVQIMQLVYDLFRWEDAEYHFNQEESIGYDEALFTPISAETILMEGARMVDEWPLIEKRIPSRDLVFRRTHQKQAPEHQRGGTSIYDSDVDLIGGAAEEENRLSLAPDEVRVLRLVDRKRTVQDIVDRSQLGEFETCRILYDLMHRDMIALEGGAVGRQGPEQRKARKPLWPVASRLVMALLVILSVVTLPFNPLSPLGSQGSMAFNDVLQPVSRSRLSRLDLALRVFYLEKQALPKSLDALVRESIVKESDLIDPWKRPYVYRIEPAGYEISGKGPGGATDPALAVTKLFPPSERLVIEGGTDVLAPEARGSP